MNLIKHKYKTDVYLGIALLALSIIIMFFIPKWVVDDAFINFRYRNNFLAGHGLVFNDGIKVEGFTSLLQILILIISPFNPTLTSHIISIFFFFLSFYYIFKLLGNKFLMIGYILAPITYVHIFSGLETIMFVSLTILVYYLLKTNSNKLLYGLILISLCRPEGILFSLIIILTNKSIRTKYFISLIVSLLLRYWYYDDLFPNPFYAKFATQGFKQNIVAVLEFTFYYLLPYVLIFLLYRKKKQNYSNAVKASLVFIAITIIYYLGTNLVMNYSYRFYFHLFPLLILTCDELIQTNNKMRISIIISVQLAVYLFLFPNEYAFVRNYKNLIDNVHTKAGLYINSKVKTNDWIISDFDAGAIPYFANCKCVDLGGLNDKVIAKGNLNITQTTDYVFSYNPKIFVITSYKWDYLKHNERTSLITQDPRFNEFFLDKKFGIPGTNYFQFVYKRRN